MRPAPLIVGLLTLGLAGIPLGPAPAAAVLGITRVPATTGPDVETITGAGAVDIAVQVAHDYEPGVAVAYIASHTSGADAVVAAARAGSMGGPLLLTHSTELPAATRDELRRLDPGRLVVVGGESAVSATVLESLTTLLPDRPVQRVAGQDRYATAADLASFYPEHPDVVYVVPATGDDGASLAAAALAARDRAPLLLVAAESVPPATAVALTRLLPRRIVVVGGEATIADTVVIELESLVGVGLVARFAGADRYVTAALVAREFTAPGYTYVVPGEPAVDGVAAAARAGHDMAPVLLTRADALPHASAKALSRLEPCLVYVVGEGTDQTVARSVPDAR